MDSQVPNHPLLPQPGGTASASAGGLTEETGHLLALMATGATDAAIARMLGVSERTVLRRITRVQQQLGAQSRFQLGLLVNGLQWLPLSAPPARPAVEGMSGAADS
ncbi:helix-turn-helix transcriptional regulator [Streptomyces sp. ZAF1911]|uniref:helix-turn-helix domain-containing protein n=1 Tax=Streptomyces sp. ZAF1911 TaxID=2944129 RepID=UPI00237B7899|nr:helix-turn-helix transcriptional regulator [Streptomyces sp. ZAF1911]MDD9375907.1 helix-turn-helix transcriptional regulator [Streptomyces sp. ZAF1911]